VGGVDAFVLVTRGAMRFRRWTLPGFEGTAAVLPAALLALLALRGARLRGVGAVDMPQNWTVAILAGRPEGAAAIVVRGDAAADAFAARLLRGERAIGGWARAAALRLVARSEGRGRRNAGRNLPAGATSGEAGVGDRLVRCSKLPTTGDGRR